MSSNVLIKEKFKKKLLIIVFIFGIILTLSTYNSKNKLPKGFVLLNDSISNGPITQNKDIDTGTKRNLYQLINKENENGDFNYDEYNYNEYMKLENETHWKSEYFCQINSKSRPEVLKGNDLTCPEYYTIVIDKAFYGRHPNDKEHCPITFAFLKYKKIKEGCGYEPVDIVKSKCEGKQYCTLIPSDRVFKDTCVGLKKYLHIEYHCVKKAQLKKKRISIVSFYDNIKSNTIQEHSVSEFYQYSNIHGYEYSLSTYNYIPDRAIYFMKFQPIIEKLMEGLKNDSYDWIVWVDSDIIITNPNIKIETFLPDEKMSKVHLIAAFDYRGRKDVCCGLNAGVLFIRVHEWSLNLFTRAMAYPYYRSKMLLGLDDQTALNNVLIEFKEEEHFIIVPHQWFNTFQPNKDGFLLHIMGGNQRKKERYLRKFFKASNNSSEWISRTNEDMRKEILDYYHKDRKDQLNIVLQP
ncbi:hypothetical protein BCR36DRAFT_407095 [Piromyces finnis]|uniref:SUEL-type lectin domain-containing protein n=1 Tax=Piromyces finnis TaxID=1754191 RepID=A0A1Y1UW15_9FUNG|nr:hypothetical protein BCR36DRAFT_407095 [Piromyces finnis]|eukprot:ORX42278.1 hypothetical protein BCR36DRAFT_407095 [Piromyces finnis]